MIRLGERLMVFRHDYSAPNSLQVSSDAAQHTTARD
jgi:hypothetical protein